MIGILPMGGNGTRLGLPFPKPLAPTITKAGIVPLYHHALGQLRQVCASVVALVNETTDDCLRRDLTKHSVSLLETNQPTLPGALGVAGRWFPASTWLAVALPDSIWHLDDGRSLRDVVRALRSDGAVALFTAATNELDEVEVDADRVTAIHTKPADGEGWTDFGWGAFMVRAGALAGFTGDEKDGPQLGRLDLGWAHIGGYVDLGTEERYVRWHDQR